MIKKICIFGIGGLGGFYGGKIASAITKGNNNYEVFFVGRGEHLKEIQNNGLILNTPDEKEIVCKPAKAIDRCAQLPEVDIIFVCVKEYDLQNAIKDIAQNCKQNTYVVPLLNGVDIYERVRENLDDGIVFPTCVYISSAIEKPGTVTQFGGNGIIHMGKDPRYLEVVPEDLFNLFDETGIKFDWLDDAFPAIWEKFIFMAGFGLYTAYSGKVFGEIIASEKAKQQVRDVMNEVYALSKAVGVELSETIVEDSLNKASGFDYDTKTSYQRDIERKAKNNEGDLFGGTIIRMGKKHNISTEATRYLYDEINKR